MTDQGGSYGGSADLKSLRDRLKSKKLSDDDVSRIDAILAREAGEHETIGGKRIVAHLPHGMDVVK
jgi:hypothetical protein